MKNRNLGLLEAVGEPEAPRAAVPRARRTSKVPSSAPAAWAPPSLTHVWRGAGHRCARQTDALPRVVPRRQSPGADPDRLDLELPIGVASNEGETAYGETVLSAEPPEPAPHGDHDEGGRSWSPRR
jgi:hypothetical protein